MLYLAPLLRAQQRLRRYSAGVQQLDAFASRHPRLEALTVLPVQWLRWRTRHALNDLARSGYPLPPP